jgi:aminobenzoyl-glutamate transport protein
MSNSNGTFKKDPKNVGKTKKSKMDRFIKSIEVAGNKLPHPFNLFVIFALVTIIISVILASMGVSVDYMAAKAGEAPVETTIAVKNLLTFDTMRDMAKNFTKIYVNFPPLGLVMVMIMGIGLFEYSGLMSALMRKTIMGAPTYMVTAALVFVGINSNLASNAGIIFAVTIGGALFKALGRNPRIGVVTGFAAASGGFTANLFIAGTDSLLAGITESAAKSMGVEAAVHPLINWYFMIAATFVLTIVITLVTEKIIVKIFGDDGGILDASELEQHKLTENDKRGLRWAGIGFIIFIVIMAVLALPQGSFFRNDAGGFLPKSPLMDSIVPIIFFFFAIVGIAYGIGARTITSESDIPKLMQKGLSTTLPFIVVSLSSAIFLELLSRSNMATLLAVKGGLFLETSNIGPIPLLIGLILLTALINLTMTSGSQKWLILAPIFVPMFSVMNISPAMTQLIYRIGDSATNIISPVQSTIPIVLGLFEMYRSDPNEKVGIGSIFSMTIPYSIAILITLTLLAIAWFLLGLPLGPGASVTL